MSNNDKSPYDWSTEKSFLVKLEPGARVGGAAFKVPASCVMEVA